MTHAAQRSAVTLRNRSLPAFITALAIERVSMFASVLTRIVTKGSLRLIDPFGHQHLVGDGSPCSGTIRLLSRRVELAMLVRPTLALGEGYMNGSMRIEDGSIYDVLAVLARNADRVPRGSAIAIAARLGSWLKQRNALPRARRNVAHHYDLSPSLYNLFLDDDKNYSCAYFISPDCTLEAAQAAKQRHVASKLRLDQQDLRVLDIGSGWGGLALYLAGQFGADVTGITLSQEQLTSSMERAAEAGMEGRVRFALRDYREQRGQFDRIVSVGMFEHVGKRNYGEFFSRLRDLLTEDGIALLHTCGFTDRPGPIDPFIRKYIFPGADQPSLSEVSRAIERSGLIVTDVEVLRLHYAETLRCWRTRFCAHWDEAVRLYDERFCRMWEYYLTLCEVGFRHRTSVVFQLQITRDITAAPITRDYMVDCERSVAGGQAPERSRKA